MYLFTAWKAVRAHFFFFDSLSRWQSEARIPALHPCLPSGYRGSNIGAVFHFPPRRISKERGQKQSSWDSNHSHGMMALLTLQHHNARPISFPFYTRLYRGEKLSYKIIHNKRDEIWGPFVINENHNFADLLLIHLEEWYLKYFGKAWVHPLSLSCQLVPGCQACDRWPLTLTQVRYGLSLQLITSIGDKPAWATDYKTLYWTDTNVWKQNLGENASDTMALIPAWVLKTSNFPWIFLFVFEVRSGY